MCKEYPKNYFPYICFLFLKEEGNFIEIPKMVKIRITDVL